MRRRSLLCVLAVVPVLAGCSGKQALEAQQLLQQASAAQSRLTSESFTGRLTVSANGHDFAVKLTGGAYARGARAGDMYVNVELSGSSALPVPGGKFGIVRRGSTVAMSVDGKRTIMPASVAASSGVAQANLLAGLDLTKYVTDVKVEHGQMLGDEPATKVTGVLDTAALVKGLSGLSGLGAATGQSLPDVSNAFGDARVVAYFSDRTHLMLAALVDLSVHASGQSAQMHFDLGFTGFNQRVAIPSV